MVGRYFSVTLGKDWYGQSEGGSCLGMLQGSVEHLIHVGGGGHLKENTCSFGERTSAFALGRVKAIAKAGKPQVDDTVIHSRKLQVCARRNLMSSKRI